MNTKTNNTKNFQKKHKTKKKTAYICSKNRRTKVDGATCLYWQES